MVAGVDLNTVCLVLLLVTAYDFLLIDLLGYSWQSTD